MTAGEAIQLIGDSIARNATETKNTIVEVLTGVKEGAVEQQNIARDNVVEKKNEVVDAATEKKNAVQDSFIRQKNDLQDKTIEQTDKARSNAADKIGEARDYVEPPSREPDGKTVVERLQEVGSTVAEQAKNITSNIHAHPDEQIVLDDMKKDESEDSKALGAKIQEAANNAAKNLEQFGEDTKQTTKNKSDAARSWTADKLGDLEGTVEPPLRDEPSKTLGDRLADKVGDIQSGISNTFSRAGNDPHEDPKLRGDKMSLCR